MCADLWVKGLSIKSDYEKSELQKYKNLINDFMVSLKCFPKQDQRHADDAEKTIKYFSSLMIVHGIDNNAEI